MGMDTGSAVLLLAIGLVVLLAFGIYVALSAPRFFRELQYLNMEISRTTGSEREYWLKERRRLWLSLIPFVPR